MFSVTKSTSFTESTVLIEAVCLSTDSKPTTGIANGSTIIEINTGKVFMYDEEGGSWDEIGSSGGGGGGGGVIGTNVAVTLTTNEAFFQGMSGDVVKILLYDANEGGYVKEKSLSSADTNLSMVLIGDSATCLTVYAEPTITGSATASRYGEYDEWNITISGDCTITVS